MSTQKNEHNPDKGNHVVRDILGEPVVTEPKPVAIVGHRYDTVADLREATEGHACEKRCPKCNSTLLRNKLGDEWCSFVECDFGLDKPITPPTDTTGSGREGETVELAEAMERGRRAGVAASVIAEYSQHILSLERQRDAALAQVEEKERVLTSYRGIEKVLRDDLAKSQAHVEALRRDGERLDWIETNATVRWPWGNTVMFAFSVVAAEPFDEQPTLRAAIDSAQRQEGMKAD